MKRTALVIAADCLASILLNWWLVYPSENYCLAMMAVDGLAAFVVLIRPAGRAQAMIGLTFLLQIGFYAGRLLNGDRADLTMFWQGLSLLAMLQLVLLFGWWVHERFDRRAAVLPGGEASAPAYREGMGP